MIKNIVFDMGSVLLKFDGNYFLEQLPLSSQERELLMKRLFRSAEWSFTDWGVMNEDDLYEYACKVIPEHLHKYAHKLIYEWDDPIIPIPGMADLVRELKDQGYKIYLLSNASCRQHEYWPRVPGNEYFDGTLISADVKMVKPNPEIYKALFEKFDLDPGECIFIDDLSTNIAAARICGMKGIVFHGNAQELREELANALK